MKNLFLAILIAFLFQSCQVFLPLLGMRAPKKMDDKKIERYADKIGIEDSTLFKITDNTFYKIQINSDSIYRNKNFFQPLQVIFFNEMDSAQFHLINCNVGGYPILEWNRFGSFDTYPPQMRDFYKVDSVLYKPDFIKFLEPVGEVNVHADHFKSPLMVVLYSRMLHKNTKHLVALLNDYQQKFKQAKLIYVNTDNFYFEE